jgi:hypothetical protein
MTVEPVPGLGPVRRALVTAGWLGLLALQLLVGRSYVDRGAFWHWLLHVPIGLGVGLAVGALLWAATGRRMPAVACGLRRDRPPHPGGGVRPARSAVLDRAGPDVPLLRMPHEPSMNLHLGHIAIHTGPSPVLVALPTLLLGGWGWVAAASRRRWFASALSVTALVLLLIACLMARPLPSRHSDFPHATAPLGAAR